MKEEHKTKEQLTNELAEMRQRIAELEASEAARLSVEQAGKRAEEAVPESEKHYRSMVESIDLGMNLIDCDHNIVMVNVAQARHFNKSPREMVGKKCYRELEKRDTVCPHCPGVQAIATGRPAQVETQGVRDDGSRFNVRLRAFPTFGQDGTVIGFVEIGQDITERKAVEEALAWERNLLRALMDTIPDHIYFKDTDSRFIRVSKALAEWFGLSDPVQAVGKTDFDFFTEEHARPAYEDEQRIVRTGQPLVNIEERETWPGRPDTWVLTSKMPLRDEGGKIVGTLGLSKDITNRKRAEEKIEHLNLVLSAIRNVNQLITRERDRGRLLQGACETLIATRGYHSAWIALLDESEGLVTTAEAGVGEDFLSLVERLKRGELIVCGQRALKQSGIVVTEDPSSACADCPLSSMYDGRGAATVRLEYGGKVYGLLSVSIPRDLAADEEEQALFREVAGDVAFALHSAEQEKALAWERYLLKTLMDNVPDAIYFKDTDSRFIRTNKAHAKRWFGLSDPAEAVGKTDFDFFSEEHARQAYEDEQEIIRTGQPLLNMEERETWPDRPDTWVVTSKMPLRDEEGKIIGTFGITRDITDRKRAEEALAEERNLLRTLIDHLPDFVYVKDAAGRYRVNNLAHARHLGFETPEEFFGKTAFEIFPPHLAEKFYADDLRVLQTGQAVIDREEPGVGRIPGTEVWNLTTKVPLRDDTGKIVGLVGITRDITERKRAEKALKEYAERLEEMVEERTQELREAQEQLIRKEKLAVLGQLAGGVGHELRNPLGAISNAVYFLNMALEEPEPDVKETLEILQKEVRTSEMIISSLLDFARTKPPARRKVDINDVVREALTRAAVPGKIEVVSQLDGTLPIILADPDQLGQVFGNIILNAIQAMPEGGRLVVKTSEVSEKLPKSEWVAISFTDTGVGIPEENLGKIFEPLFTTRAKGIGLGLAVTRTLVQGHGGTIEVQSEVGKGTTFTVQLPILEF